MKKRRLELFQTNDYEAMENHLGEMAKKGWFLKKIGGYFWTYEKGEPKDLTYEVTYFSEASDFNPYPTDNQEAYYEYCRAAGWTLVAEKGVTQVFSADRENTTPIETDEDLKFKAIHKYMMKGMIPVYGVMLLFSIALALGIVHSIRSNPIMFFAESSSIYKALIIIVGWIILVHDRIDYITWYYGNKKALALGKKYEKNHYKRRRAVNITIICIFIVLIVLVFLTEIYWWRLLIGPSTTLISLGAMKLMKKAGASKETNIVITSAVLFVAVFMLFEASDSLEEYLYPNEGSQNEYNYKDKSFHPLTIEDLGYESQDNYPKSSEGIASYTVEAEDSFAVSYIRMDQKPELYYEVANIKIGLLHDIFKDYFLDTGKINGQGTFILVDEPGWEAVEVYQLKTETKLKDKYIICYEDKILSITPDFPLEMEQIKIIRERLIE